MDVVGLQVPATGTRNVNGILYPVIGEADSARNGGTGNLSGVGTTSEPLEWTLLGGAGAKPAKYTPPLSVGVAPAEMEVGVTSVGVTTVAGVGVTTSTPPTDEADCRGVELARRWRWASLSTDTRPPSPSTTTTPLPVVGETTPALSRCWWWWLDDFVVVVVAARLGAHGRQRAHSRFHALDGRVRRVEVLGRLEF